MRISSSQLPGLQGTFRSVTSTQVNQLSDNDPALEPPSGVKATSRHSKASTALSFRAQAASRHSLGLPLSWPEQSLVSSLRFSQLLFLVSRWPGWFLFLYPSWHKQSWTLTVSCPMLQQSPVAALQQHPDQFIGSPSEGFHFGYQP